MIGQVFSGRKLKPGFSLRARTFLCNFVDQFSLRAVLRVISWIVCSCSFKMSIHEHTLNSRDFVDLLVSCNLVDRFFLRQNLLFRLDAVLPCEVLKYPQPQLGDVSDLAYH